MIIGYSQSFNRYMLVDAYPIPAMKQMFVKSIQNYLFFKYLSRRETNFSLFDACDRLYQFKRLAFWLTDGVRTFQRVIEDDITKEKSEKT